MKKMASYFTLIILITVLTHPGLAQEQIYSGTVTDVPAKSRDGVFDFALVLPTVTKEQVMNFSLSTFVSPLNDTLRALGQKINVPSNLSVPTQTERYILNIRLSKPEYRLPWSDGNLAGIGALHGNFIFRDVIDKVRRGDPIFSLINDFTFRSYSVITNPNGVQNIRAGVSPLMFQTSLTAENDNESNYTSLGVSFQKTSETTYFPIDLKKLANDSPTKLRATQEGLRVVAIVPNSIFGAATLNHRTQKTMPFSLAWNYINKNVNPMLPILNGYVQATGSSLFIDASALNAEFNIIGYKISLIDQQEKTLVSKLYTGSVADEVSYPLGYDFSKVRLDVYASKYDIPKLLLNPDEIIDYTDFVSRYEEIVF